MNTRSMLISVITPTYNRAHVIRRAIDSVLNQTYLDFEYIIIDDGSKDNTTEVIQEIISNHPHGSKIKYHQHERNMGQNAALNTGLSFSSGTFVAFLDSDDEWLPTMLEAQLKQFVNDPEVHCSYTWPGYFNKRKKLVPGRKYSIKGFLYKDALAQGYICNPTTLMARKICFDALGGFKTEFVTCQDDDICLRLAKRYKFGLVPKIQAIIHDDAGNQTITNRRVYADDWHKLFLKYETDILLYCGEGVFAKHLNKCALLYFGIGDRSQAATILSTSLKRNRKLTTYLLKGMVLLPMPVGQAIYRGAQWLQRTASRIRGLFQPNFV